MEFNVPFQHKYGYIRDDIYQGSIFEISGAWDVPSNDSTTGSLHGVNDDLDCDWRGFTARVAIFPVRVKVQLNPGVKSNPALLNN